MIQADAETWGTYLKGVTQKEQDTHVPGNLASPQDTMPMAKDNDRLAAAAS